MATYLSPDEAVYLIKNNEHVFVHGGAATPQVLVQALARRNNELENVTIMHMHTEGEIPYAKPEYSNSFTVNSFFMGNNLRPYQGNPNVQYIPAFLSEIPALFRMGIIPVDTALVQVSEPDIHGYCSLGVSVDIAKAATDTARKIVAIINPMMPRSHGDGQIHISRFKAMVHSSEPIFECGASTTGQVASAIGQHIASLIEDGSTIQTGIGSIPDAVLDFLGNHKDLGVHTEMFSDGILPLVERGVINGSRKKKHAGKIVSSFAMGRRKLYDFIDDNPMVAMLDIGYVNDVRNIAANDKVVAINSAIEIDLSGQVCSDSIGSRIYSGVGGQMDFIRGASMSKGGKPIIAMASQTSGGLSKIVASLKPGAGVVTTRAHVHYVVTEYGIANLYGKNLAQRARELIAISHPDHREALQKQAHQLFG